MPAGIGMLKESIPGQGSFLNLAIAFIFLLLAAALVGQFASQWGRRLVPAATVVTLARGVWSISFVSLTTLGYDEITPVAPFPRFLVCMEAVAGQFCMTILVASLVGMRIAKRVADGGRSRSET